MSSFESLIGSAMLGDAAARDLSIVRLAVKSAVCSRVTCRCGSVLDQSDAVLLSDGPQSSTDSRAMAIVCPACFDACKPERIRAAARCLPRGFFACTWNGEERLGGEA